MPASVLRAAEIEARKAGAAMIVNVKFQTFAIGGAVVGRARRRPARLVFARRGGGVAAWLDGT